MTRLIAMLCFDNAQILDVVGPLEVFNCASNWLGRQDVTGEPAYRIALVAKSAAVRMSNGMQLAAEPLSSISGADTLIVAGGLGFSNASNDRELIDWLNLEAGRSRRVAGVCTGSVLLAAAGLLGRRKATTHWCHFGDLGAADPSCDIDRSSIFVRSGKFITSAGVTAGMDMALALVEEDHGKAAALHVAQQLVLFLRRPGSQAQFSRHIEAELRDTPLAGLEQWVLLNLDAELSVGALARRFGKSERQFCRIFRGEMDCTPAAWVRQLRLEQARRELELGYASLKEVARRCGLGDEQSLRRAFHRLLGVSPTQYARRFS